MVNFNLFTSFIFLSFLSCLDCYWENVYAGHTHGLIEKLNDDVFSLEEATITPDIATSENCIDGMVKKNKKKKALIIGAGTVGVMTANKLLAAGWCVEIWDRSIDAMTSKIVNGRQQILIGDDVSTAHMPTAVIDDMYSKGIGGYAKDYHAGPVADAQPYTTFQVQGFQNSFLDYLTKTYTDTFVLKAQAFNSANNVAGVDIVIVTSGKGSFSDIVGGAYICSGDMHDTSIKIGKITITGSDSTDVSSLGSATSIYIETGVKDTVYNVYVTSIKAASRDDELNDQLDAAANIHKGTLVKGAKIDVNVNLCFKEKFSKKINGIPWVLAGDSAFTTHYWTGTGFNFGFKSALKLIDNLSGVADNMAFDHVQYGKDIGTLQKIQLVAINSKRGTVGFDTGLFDAYVIECGNKKTTRDSLSDGDY